MENTGYFISDSLLVSVMLDEAIEPHQSITAKDALVSGAVSAMAGCFVTDDYYFNRNIYFYLVSIKVVAFIISASSGTPQ